MIVIRERRSVNPIVEMSIPSTAIDPEVASTKRKKLRARVDFPQPVGPERGERKGGERWKGLGEGRDAT